MNFSDLEQSVNHIAKLFNLNVKLINLDNNPKKTHKYSDEGSDIEELFGYSSGEDENVRPPTKKSMHSEKRQEIEQELNSLKEEKNKLDDLIKEIQFDFKESQDIEKNISSRTNFTQNTEESKIDKSSYISNYKSEAENIMNH